MGGIAELAFIKANNSLPAKKVTFGTGTVTAFGRTLYRSNDLFALADGARLDVEAFVWMASTATANGIWIGNGTTAIYNVREAAGTDYTLGRYSVSDASLALTRASASAMVGLNRMSLSVVPHAGGTQAVATVEGTALSGASGFGATDVAINSGGVYIYLSTSDIAKCRVYARHIPA